MLIKAMDTGLKHDIQRKSLSSIEWQHKGLQHKVSD